MLKDPLPPEDFQAFNYTNSTIALSWKAPGGLHTGYELFMNDEEKNLLNTSNSNILQKIIFDLKPFTRYNFSLRTVVGTGNDRVNSEFTFASEKTSKL